MEHTVEKNPLQAVARAGPVLRAVAGVALAVFACAVLPGCDKAIKPKEVKYNIYFAGSWYQGRSGDDYIYSRHLYVYDADSLTLRDSIPIPNQAVNLEVSPDGHGLYAWCVSWSSYESNLIKIDDPPPIRLTPDKRGFILREEVVKDGDAAALHFRV
jgi:hypothetical protein